MGRSPRGFTAHWLTGQVRRLAGGYPSPALAAAAEALEHVDPRAFGWLLADLPESTADRLLRAMGRGHLARARLEAIAAAPDPPARRAAFLGLCDLLASDPAAVEGLPAAAVAPLCRELLGGLEWGDLPVRAAAHRATKTLFGESNHFVVPDPGAMLGRLVSDLDTGRLEPIDGLPGLFAARVPEVAPPGAGLGLGGGMADLQAECRPEGLALRIHNRGGATVAVDPLSLRYFLVLTVAAPWPVPTSGIVLGTVPFPATVSARTLVLLAPGEKREFMLPSPGAAAAAATRWTFVEDWRKPHVAGSCAASVLRLHGTCRD